MIRNIKNFLHSISALIAVVWYGYPGRAMTVIGVTGTDGKSTTTHLIYHILLSCGKKVSMVSTVEAHIAGVPHDTGFHVTTPNAWKLQQLMRQAVQAGSTHFILEVTSHGLDQKRVLGASIDIGVITNISHEHIDYHKTYEQYRDAKAKILHKVRWSVLNGDDDNFAYLLKRASGNVITFSQNHAADITPASLSFKPIIPGSFNISNCLAAAAVSRIIGVDDTCISKAISSFQGLPGRMEQIRCDKGFYIYIDFAHKPNAMEQALLTARQMTKGRVIAVFGCAGLRDHIKRPTMGELSGRIADISILTAEDPRTEDVRDIIDQIALGCIHAGAKEIEKQDAHPLKKKGKDHIFIRIPDRQEAINYAIREAAKRGDVVLLLGKGHEKSMCWGKTEYPWNEHKAVEKSLYGAIKPSEKAKKR